MRGFIAYFVGHRTAANLVLAAMLLAGLYAAVTLRTQYFPDVVVERVTVSVAWRGAGPEEVERRIVAPLEPALLAVEGVEEIEAVAREGSAVLTIEFEPGWDMGRAAEEATAAVDRVTSLPEGADEPVIRRRGFFDKVTDVAIWGPVPPERIIRYAEELENRLFAAGVTRTSLRGAPDPTIRVDVPESALVRHDLSLAEVSAAIRAAVDAAPAGEIAPGGARVRAGAERRSAEEIGDITLRRDQGGAPLRVRDVATVALSGARDGEAYFVGDAAAVELRVDRNAVGDALEIVETVRQVTEDFAATLPEGVEARLVGDATEAISDRLSILYRNGAVGLALVLVFLFLFLSARTAFWVAAGIPAAMAATLGLMLAFGFSLNMMTLFALLICLGVVVDDAIVVGEHADMLARRGATPEDAAKTAAIRMFPPVFAASLTTVIAFMSMAVISGRFGELVFAIPATVTLVVVASLVESFVVLPAHMRHALSAKSDAPWYDAPSRAVDRGMRFVRERGYKPVLRLALRARWPVLGGAVALLLHAFSMFADGTVRWRFFNAPENAEVQVNFVMLPGASRAETAAMTTELQRALAETDAAFAAEYGRAPVVFAMGVVGGEMGRGIRGADDKDQDLLGGVAVEMISPDDRPYGQGAFIRRWREAIETGPMVETLAFRGGRAGPGGDDVSVTFTGEDSRTLKAASEALKAALAPFSAVAGVEDTLPYDSEELTLSLTPLGESLGFTIEAVGRDLNARFAGLEAAEFPLGGRTATIEVAVPEAERAPDYLERAVIRAPDGAWVPLGAVVDASRDLGFGSILRRDGRPVLTVSGAFATDDPAAQAEVRTALEERILPSIAARFGVDWRLTGLAEQERRFLSEAGIGFLICLAGIYAALTWIFGSWTRPLVVILTIPLGLIGVIWGHHWMATPVSMFSVVGMIGMAGIIINDAIVLTTTVDEYARRRALIPAMVEACGDRLRAVFLTTATTVAGLAPLLFERSAQAQFLKPTVITLAFGLGFGMILVLVVAPALIAAQRDVAAAAASGRRLLRYALGRRRFGRPRSA